MFLYYTLINKNIPVLFDLKYDQISVQRVSILLPGIVCSKELNEIERKIDRWKRDDDL